MFAHQRERGNPAMFLRGLGLAAVVAATLITLSAAGQPAPVKVTIKDEKPVIVEAVLPVDPTQHVQLQTQGNMMFSVRVDNQTTHLGVIQALFKVDEQVLFPGNPPSQLTVQNQGLAKNKSAKVRNGSRSVCQIGKLVVTQEVEVIPTKAKAGQKRRLDSVLVHYLVENKDSQPHKFGLRTFMDVFIVDNDGALFAAPTQPGKVLDGVELKGKLVPEYLQFLQRPDLKNPGFIAHMTFNLGKQFDMPDRIILTNLGAQIDQWNLGVMQAMGDSAMGVFWEPKEIKPGGKRSIAYAYGQGIAPVAEGEGQITINLSGSFEPGKLFTISAMVQDPAPGQSLALELPAGMELMEGKERQPVPAHNDDGNSMVLWKARVLDMGQFTVRVRSSTGVTQAKIVTISRPG
jgi:hypothetical protein